MSDQNELLAQLQQREKELQEQLKAWQTQANTLEQNSSGCKNATAEIPKVETELKETQSKIEELKEQSIAGKIETGVEIIEPVLEEVAGHFGYEGVIDPIVGGLAAGVAVEGINMIRNHEATEAYIKGAVNEKIETVKEFIAEQFPEKDVAKEWEKDIEKKKQDINEKFDKELKETEKSLQKQSDYIEKKYDGQEKQNKLNELIETGEKVKTEIEKDRVTELQKQEERMSNLEKIKEVTAGMEEKERERIISQQRELEKNLEQKRER